MAEETRRVIRPSRSLACSAGSSSLPSDVLQKIAVSFELPTLWAASMVCTEWSEALKDQRQAMHFVHLGKKLEHGHSGESQNLDKALELYLKGADRGCAVAMVEAGHVLVKMEKRAESIEWLKQAAELGNVVGQFYLGFAYLLGKPCAPIEAAKWFNRAALAGHRWAQCTHDIFLKERCSA